jgi:hypothetical protein
VRAGELVVGDVVAGALERRDQPAAAPVDGQHAVRRTVRDVDARRALLHDRRHEAGRVRQYGVEQVAVADADGQRVRRAVGEPAHRDAVDRVAREHVVQQRVEPLDVRAEPAGQYVPRRTDRREPEEQHAVRLGERLEQRDDVLRVAAGTVHQHGERSGPGEAGRHDEHRVAVAGRSGQQVPSGLAAGDGRVRAGRELGPGPLHCELPSQPVLSFSDPQVQRGGDGQHSTGRATSA